MVCNCNCNNNTDFHIITAVTVGTTTAVVTATNNTNLSDLQSFCYRTQCGVTFTQPTTPLPVTITINGVAVPLLDHNGIQITTSNLPRRGCGRYVATGATGAPYVILYTARTVRTLV